MKALILAFTITSTIQFLQVGTSEPVQYAITKTFETKEEAWNVFEHMPKDGKFHECRMGGTPPRSGSCKVIRVHEPVLRREWEEKAKGNQ